MRWTQGRRAGAVCLVPVSLCELRGENALLLDRGSVCDGAGGLESLAICQVTELERAALALSGAFSLSGSEVAAARIIPWVALGAGDQRPSRRRSARPSILLGKAG